MEAVFLKIVNLSLIAGILVLAVLLLRLVFRKAPRWLICAMWGLVALRLAVPVTLESSLSLLPSAEPLPESIITGAEPRIESGIPGLDRVVNPLLAEAFAPAPEKSADPLQLLTGILARVWLAGLAVMLLYAVISTALLKRKLRTSTPYRKGIRQSEKAPYPFVLGVLRPVIYLPYQLDEEALPHVIAHERAHIRRKDHWWKPLGFLLLSVYWFHPLMWVAYFFLCRDIEAACDEKVIRTMDRDALRAYSAALLGCSTNRRHITACPVAFGEVGVRERIKRVMNYKKPAFWIVLAALLACAVTAVCLLTKPASGADDKLKVSMDMAIAEQNEAGRSEGAFSACAYEIFRVKKHGRKTAVYAWVLYEEFDLINGTLQVGRGNSAPTVLTFDCSGEDTVLYPLEEYWIPRDGNKYPGDIRKKFPVNLRKKVFGFDSSELHEQCLKEAEEYFACADLTDGTHVPDPEKLSLSVTEADLNGSKPSLTVKWRNLGKEVFGFGEEFCLYEYRDGQYVRLPENDTLAFDLVLHELLPGGMGQIRYDLAAFSLEQGRLYRLFLSSFEPCDYWIDFRYGEAASDPDAGTEADDAREDAPPAMTVTDGVSLIKVLPGGYRWSCLDAAGKEILTLADSPDFASVSIAPFLQVLSVKPLPLDRKKSNEVTLQFTGEKARSVSVTRLGDGSRKPVPLTAYGGFELAEGTCIYQVDAVFERGQASYGFIGNWNFPALQDPEEDTSGFSWIIGDSSTDPETLKKLVPEYFGLGTSKGLEVYVWQMGPTSYRFGLLPGTNREKTAEEIWDLKGISAAQMRAVLSSYALTEEEIFIIPFQHPLSSYIGEYWLHLQGEDESAFAARQEAYLRNIRKLLFD